MYPALAVAEAVSTYQPGSKLYFVGSLNGFERPLVEKGGVVFTAYDEVRAGPLHGVGVQRVLRSLVDLAVGTVQSWRLIGEYKPNVLLLTGGYVGFPVAVAAWTRRVPALIYLPDIEPALSIKVLRWLAARVAITVPESAAYFREGRTVVTGYPVRAEMAVATREAAIERFKLAPQRPILLVFGGSRGAQSINTAIMGILPQLLAGGVQVVHVAGTLDHERVAAAVGVGPDAGYHLFPYLHGADMGLAMAAADLAVSRAGASVIGEFPLFALPSVLVPYPYAWRYQKVNADWLAERGAAVYMADAEMMTDLYPTLNGLFTNEEQLATMRDKAAALAQPGSARRVVDTLAEIARERNGAKG